MTVSGRSLGTANSRRLCRNDDLILTMEKRDIERLCEMAPETRGKVMLLVTGITNVKSPIPIPKAGKRLKWCTHYLNGLPASGRRHQRRAGIRIT
ncbi:hypothetical protein ACNKHU_12545 [Shigella flexneri]